ncbi:MAG: DNA methyltransferase, partial [Verrucomicrobia bacterium]|nr:DNA methyltransferase [Verrucomicrobiota bacterium]
AGWGHAGKDGVTMPGKGKIETTSGGAPAIGEKVLWIITHNIYLNETACWRNVPAEVWDYTLGGYQVIKKWLSYREKELLGRGLSIDEVKEVTNMARRIAALLLLQPALDANYTAVKSGTWEWGKK